MNMPAFIFFIVLPAILLWRIFITSSWDRERIKLAASGKRWKVNNITWEPFGPGWVGEKGDRIYSVAVLDEDGLYRNVYCKTSIWSGVYWK